MADETINIGYKFKVIFDNKSLKQIKDFKKTINSVRGVLDNMPKSLKKLTAQTRRNTQANMKFNAATGRMERIYTEMTPVLKRFSNSFHEAQRNTERATKTFSVLNKKTAKHTQVLKRATEQTQKHAKATKHTHHGLLLLVKQTAVITRNFRTLALTTKFMIAELAKLAIIPTGALIAVTAAAAKFESEITTMNALVTNMSKNMRNTLTKGILQLQAELGRGEEVAKGFTSVISAGFRSVSESMDIMSAAGKAAVATNSEIQGVTNLVISVLRNYGDQFESAIDITDVAIQIWEKGSVVFSDLARNLSTVIPVGAQAGFAFQDIGAAISLLTQVQVPIARATTALRTMISTIIAPAAQTKETIQQLQNLNIGFEGFRDAEGNIRPFIDIMQDLAKTGGETLFHLLPERRAFLAGSILTSLFPLLEKLSIEFEDLKGKTDEVFNIRQQDAMQKFNKISRRILNTFTGIGIGILKSATFGNVMNKTLEVTKDIMNAIIDQPEFISNKFEALISTVRKIISPLGRVAKIGLSIADIFVNIGIIFKEIIKTLVSEIKQLSNGINQYIVKPFGKILGFFHLGSVKETNSVSGKSITSKLEERFGFSPLTRGLVRLEDAIQKIIDVGKKAPDIIGGKEKAQKEIDNAKQKVAGLVTELNATEDALGGVGDAAKNIRVLSAAVDQVTFRPFDGFRDTLADIVENLLKLQKPSTKNIFVDIFKAGRRALAEFVADLIKAQLKAELIRLAQIFLPQGSSLLGIPNILTSKVPSTTKPATLIGSLSSLFKPAPTSTGITTPAGGVGFPVTARTGSLSNIGGVGLPVPTNVPQISGVNKPFAIMRSSSPTPKVMQQKFLEATKDLKKSAKKLDDAAAKMGQCCKMEQESAKAFQSSTESVTTTPTTTSNDDKPSTLTTVLDVAGKAGDILTTSGGLFPKGGIVNRPTLGLLGTKSREAVIPFKEGHSLPGVDKLGGGANGIGKALLGAGRAGSDNRAGSNRIIGLFARAFSENSKRSSLINTANFNISRVQNVDDLRSQVEGLLSQFDEATDEIEASSDGRGPV